MDTVLEYVELGVLVIMMVYGALNAGMLAKEAATPIVADYDDKTAMPAQGAINTDEYVFTGADLMYTVILADNNIPYPRAVKVNDAPVIRMDDEFVANKERNVGGIYSSTGLYKLGTMLDWHVVDIKYVSDTNGDYWHYILAAE